MQDKSLCHSSLFPSCSPPFPHSLSPLHKVTGEQSLFLCCSSPTHHLPCAPQDAGRVVSCVLPQGIRLSEITSLAQRCTRAHGFTVGTRTVNGRILRPRQYLSFLFPLSFPPWTCTSFPHSFPKNVSERQVIQHEAVQMVLS